MFSKKNSVSRSQPLLGVGGKHQLKIKAISQKLKYSKYKFIYYEFVFVFEL